jgi:hypothetical protein
MIYTNPPVTRLIIIRAVLIPGLVDDGEGLDATGKEAMVTTAGWPEEAFLTSKSKGRPQNLAAQPPGGITLPAPCQYGGEPCRAFHPLQFFPAL